MRDDGFVSRWRTPFAAIEMEVYRLPEGAALKFLEVRPTKDIHIPYEFDDSHFEVTYCISGAFVLEDRYCGRGVFQANRLSLTQKLGSRGDMSFCRDQPFMGISFSAVSGALKGLLGDAGNALWEEAMGDNDLGARRSLYLGTAAPWDVAGSFLQIAGCDYPHRARGLFFESKFKEILSRIIALNLPKDEGSRNVKAFEAEQIKKIPRILMERVDAPPSIYALARELSLNTTTMKKGFKDMLGLPIYAHHRNLCLERAAAALLETSKEITEIAVENGYSGSVSFCDAFKRRYGVPPGRYRSSSGIIVRDVNAT